MIKCHIDYLYFFYWLAKMLNILILMNFIFHPISFMWMMLIYTLNIILFISLWNKNYIFSIIMFLMMISGLFIIFIYFSSLISNEKMINSNLNMINNFNMFLIMLTLFFFFKNMFMHLNYSTLNLKFNFSDISNKFNINFTESFKNVSYIYEYPYIHLTFLCILFLLICLINILKLNPQSTPMRKLTYEKMFI